MNLLIKHKETILMLNKIKLKYNTCYCFQTWPHGNLLVERSKLQTNICKHRSHFADDTGFSQEQSGEISLSL